MRFWDARNVASWAAKGPFFLWLWSFCGRTAVSCGNPCGKPALLATDHVAAFSRLSWLGPALRADSESRGIRTQAGLCQEDAPRGQRRLPGQQTTPGAEPPWPEERARVHNPRGHKATLENRGSTSSSALTVQLLKIPRSYWPPIAWPHLAG